MSWRKHRDTKFALLAYMGCCFIALADSALPPTLNSNDPVLVHPGSSVSEHAEIIGQHAQLTHTSRLAASNPSDSGASMASRTKMSKLVTSSSSAVQGSQPSSASASSSASSSSASSASSPNSPPSSPSTASPSHSPTHAAKLFLTLSGSLADFTPARVAGVRSDIATVTKTPASKIFVKALSGSVVIEVTLPPDSAGVLLSKIASGEVPSLGGRGVDAWGSNKPPVSSSSSSAASAASAAASVVAAAMEKAGRPQPTEHPTLTPTLVPTTSPTLTPTIHPSYHPTAPPSPTPTVVPTYIPSLNPSASKAPTKGPKPAKPTAAPTKKPSKAAATSVDVDQDARLQKMHKFKAISRRWMYE